MQIDIFGDDDGELAATATVNFAIVNLRNGSVSS
jgi:acyl-CoA thioesterase FadM